METDPFSRRSWIWRITVIFTIKIMSVRLRVVNLIIFTDHPHCLVLAGFGLKQHVRFEQPFHWCYRFSMYFVMLCLAIVSLNCVRWGARVVHKNTFPTVCWLSYALLCLFLFITLWLSHHQSVPFSFVHLSIHWSIFFQ